MAGRDHHTLWEASNGATTTTCVMVSCCAGAELQVRRTVHGDEEILLRELYPDHDSLYERARTLKEELGHPDEHVRDARRSGGAQGF